jgi:NDP-sugar pyrophosphorylase family protein
MQAVVLAGGLGTRLWPLTKEIPKPMAPVNGVPYLEYQLRLLVAQGFRSTLILTGYLGEQIESYFQDGSALGLSLQYSREPSPLGTGGALRHAAGWLEERFALIYGDSFLPIDYRPLFSYLDEPDTSGVVVVYDNRVEDTSVRNNIDLDDRNRVTAYSKDSADSARLKYVEAGVLAFRRSILDLIPQGVVSLEKEIFPILIERRALAGYSTRQRFYDIGTPERLSGFEAYLKHDYHPHSFSH